MFRRKNKIEKEGMFTLRINGQDIVTPDEIWRLVKMNQVQVYVPIDSRISPWGVPKLFQLSQKQALELFDALADAPEEHRARLRFVLRADGKIALLHNGEHNGHDPSRVHVAEHDALSGNQNTG